MIFDHPAVQAFGAGTLTWLSISAGAALIFARKNFSRFLMDCLLGAAGGMMLAAASLGLLAPALEMTAPLGRLSFLPIICGLALGAAFLLGLDKVLPHLHVMQDSVEGVDTRWRRSALLVAAMALHHIPEGLAVGVGYGAAAHPEAIQALQAGGSGADMATAILLTASIMLQSLPEGLVVALALRAEGCSARQSFFWGVASGATAPLGALPGALAATLASGLLPIALAFAAGAMIYVVLEEVIPEANASGNGNAATIAAIGGICLVVLMECIFR